MVVEVGEAAVGGELELEDGLLDGFALGEQEFGVAEDGVGLFADLAAGRAEHVAQQFGQIPELGDHQLQIPPPIPKILLFLDIPDPHHQPHKVPRHKPLQRIDPRIDLLLRLLSGRRLKTHHMFFLFEILL